MNDKEFYVLDQQIKNEIPTMTDEQLISVEVWGELSKQEQDKRFPAKWEHKKTIAP